MATLIKGSRLLCRPTGVGSRTITKALHKPSNCELHIISYTLTLTLSSLKVGFPLEVWFLLSVHVIIGFDLELIFCKASLLQD